ncbi:hypothetical protein DRW07_04440 [Alteromonas sediminis]|uniref:Uncharacterized protein n=1 Tax=Alteromonas sediminis TaxID=2259342 RepID=A0A3N5YQV2_9ALTE|nr:hypothetical protein [Alteromonas sediminis]RPJ68651.1 hypothetical protein DRW07_04440 [Alteromonas sediminis]
MKTLLSLALTLTLATAPAFASVQNDSQKSKKKVNTSLRVIMQQKSLQSDTRRSAIEQRSLLNRKLPYMRTQA